jgi:hypothetical protein
MNKLAELLKQLGASPELIGQITESMEQYKTEVKQTLEEDFKQRVLQAKKVVAEALENEKRELARKVEVFLEARTATINREAQRQAAIGEADATKMLRGVKSLVEGIEISDKGSGQAAIAESEELKALRIQNKQLKEAFEKTAIKAKRANEIALKALERNRLLEEKFTQKPAAAPTKPAAKQTVTESKTPAQKTDLGTLRKTGERPATTRQVMTETVKRTTPTGEVAGGDPGIQAIASQLDGDPAYIR